eukprot:143016-Amphidinium_carterae.2
MLEAFFWNRKLQRCLTSTCRALSSMIVVRHFWQGPQGAAAVPIADRQTRNVTNDRSGEHVELRGLRIAQLVLCYRIAISALA